MVDKLVRLRDGDGSFIGRQRYDDDGTGKLIPIVKLSGSNIEGVSVEYTDAQLLSTPANPGYWSVPLAGFASPKYIAADQNDATGFDISDCVCYSVSFENGFTATITFEQTLDPAGLTGWFNVAGKPAANPTSAPVSTQATAWAGLYVVPAVGLRARFRVTALTVADLRARVAKSDTMLDVATGAVTIQGTSAVAGSVAEDAAASGANAMIMGLEARNTQKTAMSAPGDLVRAQATMDGKQVVHPYAIPELSWSYVPPANGIVNSAVAVPIKTAAGAGIRNYLTGLTIDHDTLGAIVELAVLDGTTVIWRRRLQVAAMEGYDVIFPTPLKSSANAALNVQVLTATTGSILVNAQGHTGV